MSPGALDPGQLKVIGDWFPRATTMSRSVSGTSRPISSSIDAFMEGLVPEGMVIRVLLTSVDVQLLYKHRELLQSSELTVRTASLAISEVRVRTSHYLAVG